MFLLALTAQAYEGQWRTYTVVDGLVNPDVTVIFQDSQGNLWFGSSSGGVSRFDGEKLQYFSGKQMSGWTDTNIISILGAMLAALVFLITRLVVQRKRAAALYAELQQKEEGEVQRVFQELKDAHEMQIALLPKEAPHIDRFELAGESLPANEVGGDFYDYLTLDNNLIGIALADVSGKGLRAAMNAVLTNGMLYEVVQFNRSFQRVLSLTGQSTTDGVSSELSMVGVILSRLNTDLRPRLYGSMFTALNLGVLNPQAKQIQYTNAGQPYPIIKRAEEVEEVELGGLPLGRMANVTYDEVIVDLHPGDYVIFYTDGLNEALNKAKEMYGDDRLKDAIRHATANLSAEEMIQHILQDVQAFVGETEQYDDMTVVVLRCLKE